MSLPIYTLVHVILSLLGIFTGLVVVGGFMAGRQFKLWIMLFLVTTILTNLTGFGFPFTTLLPSHLVGGLSLIVLAITLVALYAKHLAGIWHTIFVALSVLALYLNVFVLLAQLLQKVPALAALAPTPDSPGFAITQLIILVFFMILGGLALKGFRATASS